MCMIFSIVGLGNPGKEYTDTRHNVGRRAVEHFRDVYEGVDADIIIPTTYMNQSGGAVKDITDPTQLIVVHDDLDLPLGTVRVSYDRGSGGHKGVASIVVTLKTTAFVRVRIGIAPKTIFGTVRKPRGDARVQKFVLGAFSKKEQAVLEDIYTKTDVALTTIIEKGKDVAMNECN